MQRRESLEEVIKKLGVGWPTLLGWIPWNFLEKKTGMWETYTGRHPGSSSMHQRNFTGKNGKVWAAGLVYPWSLE